MSGSPDGRRTAQWGRLEFERHERRRTTLVERYGRVDLDTAIDDLRVHQSKVLAPGSRFKMPTSAEFARRWGWSKSHAQRLVADHETWSDPRDLEAWSERWADRGQNVGARRAKHGTLGGASTPNIEESWDERGPTLGQPRDEHGHTRGVVLRDVTDHDLAGGANESPTSQNDHEPMLDCDVPTQFDKDEGPTSLGELFARSPSPQGPQVLAVEAPVAEAPLAPKPKAKRSRKVASKTEAGRPIRDLWAQVWRERRGQVYPSSNRLLDNIDLNGLLGGLDKGVDGHVLPGELERLRRAFDVYITAADAGDPRCKGHAANVHGFRLGFGVWMQEADERADFEAFMAACPPEPKPEPLFRIWAREDAALVAAGLPPKTKLRTNMSEVRGSMAWHLKMLEREARGSSNA